MSDYQSHSYVNLISLDAQPWTCSDSFFRGSVIGICSIVCGDGIMGTFSSSGHSVYQLCLIYTIEGINGFSGKG